MSTAHSSYVFDLNNRDSFPPDEDLRAEVEGRPNAGDLLKPGMIITTSYGTGPYLIEKITPHIYYERFRAWSLILISEEPGKGFFKQTRDDNSYINEIVVAWEDDQPVFRKLFRANDDTITIVSEAGFQADRRGQLSLL